MKSKISLTIENNHDIIPVCISAAKRYFKDAGLNRHDISKLAFVVDDIIFHIIKNSFVDSQDAEITLSFEQFDKGIRIITHDFGIPLINTDIENSIDHNYTSLSEFLDEKTINFVDKISLSAKGYKGNKIIIEKYFRKHGIELTNNVLNKDNSNNVSSEPKDYTIRLLKPEESRDVSRLAYIAYHYSYPYETIYIPEQVSEKIYSKEIIPAVAVLDGSSKIISHSALMIHDAYSNSAEIGTAFTNPAYRGYGCMNKIWDYLINDIAVNGSYYGVFAMAVTSHIYSQKASCKFGLVDCALLISRAPVLDFITIQTELHQRESIIFTFKALKKDISFEFYPPKHHKQIINEIVENIGIDVDYKKYRLHVKQPKYNHSRIKIEKDEIFQIANISILQFGKDILDVINQHVNSLKINRFETLYIYMDLSDKNTGKYAKNFEEIGFFFAGIIYKENRFNLVLQLLNNQEYNFNNIKTETQFASKLKAYVINAYSAKAK